ncbi:MAG: hypothetical protein AYP45_06770 [Candidatus Brocadia carolinensis]|uniref:Uncharacterized protein n=1 Tax=Candidatus Brocadia carolinensis TaxID=1004156 RepID=A0A1V4AUR0_9BACT|nr:MAG: hypothetical protein AYP45_06770 [Candidatus Brocadia caroliniensis]
MLCHLSDAMVKGWIPIFLNHNGIWKKTTLTGFQTLSGLLMQDICVLYLSRQTGAIIYKKLGMHPR